VVRRFLVVVSLLLGVAGPGSGGAEILQHRLGVALQPQRHRLRAADTLVVRATEGPLVFLLHENLALVEVRARRPGVGGWSRARVPAYRRQAWNAAWARRDPALGAEDTDEGPPGPADVVQVELDGEGLWEVLVRYEGVVFDSLEAPSFSRWEIAEETTGLISSEGAFLSPVTCWYPRRVRELSRFRLAVTLPADWRAVSEGPLLEDIPAPGGQRRRVRFGRTRRLDGIHLVAGPYEVTERVVDGVRLLTYFYPEEGDLAGPYLDSLEGYLRQHPQRLGPYPFQKFAVVENFFPTGYGMPSFTLLGRRVLRLPFIRFTSLGHEFVHNWWGNCVLVEPGTGNWCEGLTTYCADYEYARQRGEGAGRDYRFQINRDYTAYVHEENDFPLTAFHYRTTPDTRAIGYGKCAMVFVMLEDLLGRRALDETFRRVTRRYAFRYMSWADWQRELEETAGRSLETFFREWIRRPGAPRLGLRARREQEGGRYLVSLAVTQQAPYYHLEVPVRVEFADGSRVDLRVRSDGPEAALVRSWAREPVAVALDPDHRIFRRMPWREMPPTVAWVLGEEDLTVVVPAGADSTTRSVARRFLPSGEGGRLVEASELGARFPEGSVLFVGHPEGWPMPEAARRVLPEGVTWEGSRVRVRDKALGEEADVLLFVGRHPLREERVVAYLLAASPEALVSAARKVPHYGRYSYLGFRSGENVLKGVWEVREHPLRILFARSG
jgi:hypothetical protein